MQVNSYRPLPQTRYVAPTGGAAPLAVSEPLPQPKPTQPGPGYGTGLGEVLSDFVAGAKYSTQKLIEFVKHPFDESKRQGPWRNPCEPESTAEKIGRMVPGIVLAAGAFLAGKGLFPGFNFGGPRVGWR
jgi:hypothetical protein